MDGKWRFKHLQEDIRTAQMDLKCDLSYKTAKKRGCCEMNLANLKWYDFDDFKYRCIKYTSVSYDYIKQCLRGS